MSKGTKYQGAEALPALLNEYSAKRGISQRRLAVELEIRWPGQGRSQQIINSLFRGRDPKYDPPRPYFGAKSMRSDEPSLLDLVGIVLQIPRKELYDALGEDQLAWALERSRRIRVAGRQAKAAGNHMKSAQSTLKAVDKRAEAVIVNDDEQRLERATWRAKLSRRKKEGTTGGIMGERGGGTAKRVLNGASVLTKSHQRIHASIAGPVRTNGESNAPPRTVLSSTRKGA